MQEFFATFSQTTSIGVDNDLGYPENPVLHLIDITPDENGKSNAAWITLNKKAAEHLGVTTQEARDGKNLFFGIEPETKKVIISVTEEDMKSASARVQKGTQSEEFIRVTSKKFRGNITGDKEDTAEHYYELRTEIFNTENGSVPYLVVEREISEGDEPSAIQEQATMEDQQELV